MDRKVMLQWLVPASMAGLLIVLLGVLVSISDYKDPGAPPTGPGATAAVPVPQTPITGDASGMSSTDASGLPPVDAENWKPGPGAMKVWDVREGEGPAAAPGSTVTIHYTGWLLNGKVFDSSVTRGDATTFPLGNLIRGWQEGIPGMKPGGIRRLYIPYDWAYGEAGSPGGIPPRSDLIFEVKLLGSQ